MDIIQFLDLKTIFVNELFGSAVLFVLFSFVILFFVTSKYGLDRFVAFMLASILALILAFEFGNGILAVIVSIVLSIMIYIIVNKLKEMFQG